MTKTKNLREGPVNMGFRDSVKKIMAETGPAGIEEEEKLSKPTKSDGERKKELIRARPNFIKEIGDSTLESEDLTVGKVVKWNLKTYHAYYTRFLARPLWVDDEEQVLSRGRVENHERAKEFNETLKERDLTCLYLSNWPSKESGDLVVNSDNEPRCKFCGELLEGLDHFANNGGNLNAPR